jgi:hypothetical protein
MRLIRFVVLVCVVLVLYQWIQRSYEFRMLDILPFAGRNRTGLYDVAGVLLIAITVLGATRLLRTSEDPSEQE